MSLAPIGLFAAASREPSPYHLRLIPPFPPLRPTTLHTRTHKLAPSGTCEERKKVKARMPWLFVRSCPSHWSLIPCPFLRHPPSRTSHPKLSLSFPALILSRLG